jgi:hypothetical protein
VVISQFLTFWLGVSIKVSNFQIFQIDITKVNLSMSKKCSMKSEDTCPWWNAKYGIEQFVSSENDGGTLSLSFWPLVDETRDMVAIEKASNVSELIFHGCHYLTDAFLRHLAESPYVNLSRLDLSRCDLTDATCKSIASFGRLLSIDLSDCSDIGDEGLATLMDGCKYLEEVRLSNLYRLQDEGMSFIIRNLVLMKRLRIMGESLSMQMYQY